MTFNPRAVAILWALSLSFAAALVLGTTTVALSVLAVCWLYAIWSIV